LIPPSEKHALPSNIFVTVVDVEDGKKNRCERHTNDEESWLDHTMNPERLNEEVGNAPGLDFELVEKKWESFVEVSELSQLKSEKVVGWKALAINPFTFTPEILLNLAIVDSCNGEEVVIRPLHRPGTTQISFGGMVEQNEGVGEELYQWSDVVSSRWRIVNN